MSYMLGVRDESSTDRQRSEFCHLGLIIHGIVYGIKHLFIERKGDRVKELQLFYPFIII